LRSAGSYGILRSPSEEQFMAQFITDWCIKQQQRNIQRYAHDSRAWSKHHNYCVQKGREAQFVAFCQEMIRQQPTNRQGWSFLALALKEPPVLLAFCRELVQLHPGEETLWTRLDDAIGKKEDDPELIAFCEQIIEQDADNLPAWMRLARAYKVQNRQLQLAAACHQILRIKPDDIQTWVNLGDACASSSQYTEAISAYQKALQLRPSFVKALYGLGNVYQQQNRPRDAADMYEKAVKLNPDDSTPWVWLCMAYTELGEFTKAEELIHKVEKKVPLMAQLLKDELAQKRG
jgi:cytochrome c-type biogenesis protein CcmH/NrfG